MMYMLCGDDCWFVEVVEILATSHDTVMHDFDAVTPCLLCRQHCTHLMRKEQEGSSSWSRRTKQMLYCLTSRINLQLQKLCKRRCAKAVKASNNMPCASSCILCHHFRIRQRDVEKTCSCYFTTIVFSNTHRPQTAVIAVRHSTN